LRPHQHQPKMQQILILFGLSNYCMNKFSKQQQCKQEKSKASKFIIRIASQPAERRRNLNLNLVPRRHKIPWLAKKNTDGRRFFLFFLTFCWERPLKKAMWNFKYLFLLCNTWDQKQSVHLCDHQKKKILFFI
jgi:hypothetical protein